MPFYASLCECAADNLEIRPYETTFTYSVIVSVESKNIVTHNVLHSVSRDTMFLLSTDDIHVKPLRKGY